MCRWMSGEGRGGEGGGRTASTLRDLDWQMFRYASKLLLWQII